MTRPDLEIHIEELVLHGFDPAHRNSIADHVAAAIGPALADGDVPWPREDLSIDRVDVPAVAVAQPITARDAGRIGTAIGTTVRGAR